MRKQNLFGYQRYQAVKNSSYTKAIHWTLSALFGLLLVFTILVGLNRSVSASDEKRSNGISVVYAIAGENNYFEVYCSQRDLYINGVWKIRYNQAYYEDKQVTLTQDCIYYNSPKQ